MRWVNSQLNGSRGQPRSQEQMKRRGRRSLVVDTNVMVVANRLNNEPYTCSNNCAQALLDIKHLGVIVIDDGDSILTEYRRNLFHCWPAWDW